MDEEKMIWILNVTPEKFIHSIQIKSNNAFRYMLTYFSDDSNLKVALEYCQEYEDSNNIILKSIITLKLSVWNVLCMYH